MIMKKSILSSHYPLNTRTTEINGREVSKYYTNIEDEYYALRESVGILDCSSFGVFRIFGDEATDFLNNLVTKDIAYLNVKNISECCFLNEKANVVASAYMLKTDDDFLVITPWESAESLHKWLLKNQKGDVEIEDITEKRALISVEGPSSLNFLKKFFSHNIESIAPQTFSQDILFEGEDILVARISRTGEYGYMLLINKSKAENLFNNLLKDGETEYHVKLCGLDAVETCMLEIRQPIFRFEDERIGNLFELNHQWLVQFDKDEDYVGKEKLFDFFSENKRFLTIGFESNVVEEVENGTNIYLGNQNIGKVLYTRYSYHRKANIGLALVNCDLAASDMTFQVNVGGNPNEITTISNPYVTLTSWKKMSNS